MARHMTLYSDVNLSQGLKEFDGGEYLLARAYVQVQGTAHVILQVGFTGGSGSGEIHLKTSLDDGQSWSSPITGIQYDSVNSNPELPQAGEPATIEHNGPILVGVFRSDATGSFIGVHRLSVDFF